MDGARVPEKEIAGLGVHQQPVTFLEDLVVERNLRVVARLLPDGEQLVESPVRIGNDHQSARSLVRREEIDDALNAAPMRFRHWTLVDVPVPAHRLPSVDAVLSVTFYKKTTIRTIQRKRRD